MTSSTNTLDKIKDKDSNTLFNMCCIALTVTAMTFAIRAGILGQLGAQYGLSATQLGWVNAMAFLGFPLATMFGGVLYNAMGPRKLIWLAFIFHILGLGLTIAANDVWGLLISTLFVGFANGCVEAGCNPLISDMYKNNKTAMLNRFHVWFPGGIVIGALVSAAMTSLGLGWQLQIAVMIIPTLVYGAMLRTATFPEIDKSVHSTASNLKHLFSPLYLFLVICMTITATAELGTQQWIQEILGASGAHPMIILALITGIMAIGRYFAGPMVHKFQPSGVLLGSAILATLGIFMMSQVSGNLVYVAAVIFALGVTYFWPTMLGCVGEYQPKTGALGMSLIGGAGMFAVSMWNPIIGGWVDGAKAEALSNNLTGDALTVASGQALLSNLILFPIVLIVLFAGLHLYLNKHYHSTNPTD